MVHGIDTAFTDLALGHKLNFFTAIGLLVWQFFAFVVMPNEIVSENLGEPAKCGAYGAILSRSSTADKEPPRCVLDVSAVAATPESCVVDPASSVSDCATGYVPGDIDAPSTTCPGGCVFTQASPPEPSSCTPAYAAGASGNDFGSCDSTGPGVCEFVPATDCAAYFRRAAPEAILTDAMEIHILEQACPKGCYFTPHITHEERSTFWRVVLVFVLVTLPGAISGYMEDPIRIGKDPHIKVLSVVYACACFFGGAAMIWYMIFQLGVDEECKVNGHDDLTESQRRHYGDAHKCQMYQGQSGSLILFFTFLSMITYLMAMVGAFMVMWTNDGAYGYGEDEEEDDEESK